MTTSPTPRRSNSIEAAAVAGLLFAVLYIVGATLLNSAPRPSASEAEVTDWFAESGNRTSLTTGLSLMVFAAVAFLWFVAVIRRRVGEREDKFFATVFLGSGILLAGVFLVGASAMASPAVLVDLADGRPLDADVLTALSGLGSTLLLSVVLRVQAVFVISTSTITLRSNAFNPLFSYLGYAVALLMFFIPIISEPLGLAFPIWVAILSVAMFARRNEIAA